MRSTLFSCDWHDCRQQARDERPRVSVPDTWALLTYLPPEQDDKCVVPYHEILDLHLCEKHTRAFLELVPVWRTAAVRQQQARKRGKA